MMNTTKSVYQIFLIAIFALFVLGPGSGKCADLQLVGQIGGKTACHAQEGNLLLVGIGSYVKVLDISNPNQPVELSTFNTPLTVGDIKIHSGMAYLVTGTYGGGTAFMIYDLSDPRHPVKRGSAQSILPFYNLEVSGTTAFVSEVGDFGSSVAAFDVSDPDHPVSIGKTLPLGYSFRPQLAAEGNRLYVLPSTRKLLIFDRAIDISNPIASWDIPTTQTRNFTVENGIVYLACSTNGLHIADLSDPANPIKLGRHPAGGNAQAIAVASGIVYVVNPTSGVLVIDASKPTAPTLQSSCATTDSRAVTVSGNKAAVLSDFRVDMLDVSKTPAVHAGSYEPPLLRVGTECLDFHISDNKAYVSTSANGNRIVDLSDPTSPSLIGSYFVKENGSFGKIQVMGELLFTTTDRVLKIYNINNLSYHDPIGGCLLPADIIDYQIHGWFSYVADWNGGLQIIDFSDVSHPRVSSQLTWFAELASCLCKSGEYILVGTRLPQEKNPPYSRIRIVDISDPDKPINRGYINCDEMQAVSIQAIDNLAYVAWYEGVSILDVRNPDFPTELGSIRVHSSRKMVIQGRYAYLCGMTGVTAVDISDPAHPVVAATFEAPDSAVDIAVDRDLIYVLDRLGGLYILRASNFLSGVNYENWGFYE